VAHTTTGMAGDALREGDDARERHAALFEHVMGRIFRYFRRAVWDRDEAEDLAQETLLRLERSLLDRAYDPTRSFNTWMWMKAHSVYVDWCRKRSNRPNALPDGYEQAGETDGVRAADERHDAQRALRAVARELGDEAYECFLLYYQGGLTHAEVAEVLGRNRKTIAARLDDAHRVIDRVLGRA
jgi:RNA polymerase sigma factor (sigma-70 family)